LPGEEGANLPQPNQVNPLSLALKVFGGSLAVIIRSRKIELTFPSKSPLSPLFQRGKFPPFEREVRRDLLKDVVAIMRLLIISGVKKFRKGELANGN
jgi:hypothetical protein